MSAPKELLYPTLKKLLLMEAPSVDPSTKEPSEDAMRFALYKRAGAVILVAERTVEALHRVCEYWMSELALYKVVAPVCVMVTKTDIPPSREVVLAYQRMMNEMNQSSRSAIVCEVSCHTQSDAARRAVVRTQLMLACPSAPLLTLVRMPDGEHRPSFRPRALRALQRVFNESDADGDGVLSTREIQSFYSRAYREDLTRSQVKAFMAQLSAALPKDVQSKAGMTLAGFLALCFTNIGQGAMNRVWEPIRAWGFDFHLKMEGEEEAEGEEGGGGGGAGGEAAE